MNFDYMSKGVQRLLGALFVVCVVFFILSMLAL